MSSVMSVAKVEGAVERCVQGESGYPVRSGTKSVYIPCRTLDKEPAQQQASNLFVATLSNAYHSRTMSPPLSIGDRLKIIRDIEVTAIRPHGHGAVFADDEDSASVAAGSSVSFVGNITGQMKVWSTLPRSTRQCTQSADATINVGRRSQLDALCPACCEQAVRSPGANHRVVQLLQVCLGDRRLERSELRVRWHQSSSEAALKRHAHGSHRKLCLSERCKLVLDRGQLAVATGRGVPYWRRAFPVQHDDRFPEEGEERGCDEAL